MMTQPPLTPAAATVADAAAPVLPVAPKNFWKRADDLIGFTLFMAIVVGGVVAPFALYVYGLLFR